ncbi:unnamed protein product [marine sediment metagenome]|uniref:Uncharacterized protein n=1 Tax=marine sediment metagenome TaxID=412755 RepID=X0SCI0_9ZZZZ
MSMTPPEMTSEATQPPRKSGMSGGAKLLIVLGVGGGLLVLLCCGGLIGFGVYMAGGMSQDPEVVREKTGEIAQIEIPDGLDPKMSFDVKFPVKGRMMLWTVYLDEGTESVLVLFALAAASASGDQEEMRRAMDQSLQQQGMGEQEGITVEESHTKEVEIRGETATFTIAKGVGEESGRPRIQVTGVFQGETGPAILMLNADAEKYTEEQIVEMLDSIE